MSPVVEKVLFESCAYPLFLFSAGHQSGHVTTNNNNGCHPSRSLVSGGAGAGGDSNDSDSVFSGSERGSNVSSTNGCKRKHHRECPNKTANKYPRNNSSGLCFFLLEKLYNLHEDKIYKITSSLSSISRELRLFQWAF